MIGIPLAMVAAACGSKPDTESMTSDSDSSTPPFVVDFESTEFAHSMPQVMAAGAGRLVLYDTLVPTTAGSDSMFAASTVVVVDTDTGERSTVDLPTEDSFAVVHALVVADALVVVGGRCEQQPVLLEDEENGPTCPAGPTASFKYSWTDRVWTRVALPSELLDRVGGAFHTIDTSTSGTTEHIPLMAVRMEQKRTVLLALRGTTWSVIADLEDGYDAGCGSGGAAYLFDTQLDDEHVVESTLTSVDLTTGDVAPVALPSNLPGGDFGGVNLVLGCDGSGPVLLYGGSEPSDEAPISALRLQAGGWEPIPLPDAPSTAGGLPTIEASSDVGLVVSTHSLGPEGSGLQRTSAMTRGSERSFQPIPAELYPEGQEGLLARAEFLFDADARRLIGVVEQSGSLRVGVVPL